MIEWMNRIAYRAKARGDYTTFERWRRLYLNVQAVVYKMKRCMTRTAGLDI